MDSVIYLCFGLLGLAVGSFLNLCSDRLPGDKSIVGPGSHCDTCGRRLGAIDLVPVLSYLVLRGRCRGCGSRIPLRNLLLEIAAGAAYGLLAWRFGLTFELAPALIYVSVFMLVFVIDLEHSLILNVVVYPAMAVAFVFSFFWTGYEEYWPQSGPGIALSALLGCAFGYGFMLLPYLITRGRGMGYGDVRLAGLIGLVAGFPLVIVGLLVGIIAGGLAALFLLASRVVKSRKQAIPYGPFLAAGAVAALVWGDSIFTWWLGLGG
jgi:leader peptidase (prepilin peptidase)/N-methyltransferase